MTNDKDLFDKNEAAEADKALAKKEEKATAKETKAEIAKVESAPPAKIDTSKMAPWQQALVKAEGKFLAISNQEKAKVELGFAAMLLQNNETLRKATPDSIMNAVINVARTSLTLNPTLKLCYLIPRDGKCVLDVSYIGLIKILRDNRCIKDIASL